MQGSLKAKKLCGRYLYKSWMEMERTINNTRQHQQNVTKTSWKHTVRSENKGVLFAQRDKIKKTRWKNYILIFIETTYTKPNDSQNNLFTENELFRAFFIKQKFFKLCLARNNMSNHTTVNYKIQIQLTRLQHYLQLWLTEFSSKNFFQKTSAAVCSPTLLGGIRAASDQLVS